MRIAKWWRNLTRRKQVEQDLSEELRSYQALLEDSGLSRRDALLELGGVAQVQEQVRDVRMGAWLGNVAAEVRQALRGLRRNPTLTVLATLMFALGMGASTMVFSIFQAAILQPLPFRDPGHLVAITETRLQRGIPQASFTEANFWDVQAQNHAFENVAAYHYADGNLTGMGAPEKVICPEVSVNLLRTLGVSPILGRDFSPEEGASRSAAQVLLLGNRYWHSRFGGDPKVLGRILRLDGRAYTVIGVLPPGQPFIDNQIYLPLIHRADADRGSFEFDIAGRLKAGVSMQAASADLQRIGDQLAQAYPGDDRGIGFRLDSSSSWGASDLARRALWVLLGAVTFLLLIACLNIANLLLARGMSRKREIAVRTALGASRGRLVRFVMMESLLLSGFGAALGVALAFGALRAVQSLEIRGIPRLEYAGLNPWVLGFAVGMAVLTGLMAGLAPALQAPSKSIVAALREGDRQAGSRGQGRLRSVLVIGEVALSFVLLVGAGLLIRSFSQMLRVDRGFQTENRLLFSLSMPGSYYEKGVGKQFLDQLFARLAAEPEVIAAGGVSSRPVEGANTGMGIVASSQRQLTGKAVPWAGWRIVTPSYFGAVGLPLLQGRLLRETDQPVWQMRGQPEPVRHVVISQRLSKLILPDGDPVGRHVILWQGQSGGDAEVVGVVGDSRERGLSSEPALTVYLPYGSNALVGEFVVHTRGNPLALIPRVHSLVTSLDANLPLSDVRSFDDVVHRSVAPQQFNTMLLAVFSALALLLATTGIYGVLSYSMSRRTAEMGLRVALGAGGGSILRMTLAQGMRPVLVGLAAGAAGSWWLSRYFGTLLFGVKPFDGPTYLAVAALLFATASIACYVPGRRAMRTDPAVALRIE